MKKSSKKPSPISEKKPEENPKVSEGSVFEIRKGDKLKTAQKVKLKLFPENSYLVSMLFSNGTIRQWVIATREETFTYKKRTYYLRYEDAWFDLNYNQYRLFFFDDDSVPVGREVHKVGDENFFSVRPENLKPLLKMEYVKALAESHELSKYLKMGLLFSLFSCLLSGIVLYMIYNGGQIA